MTLCGGLRAFRAATVRADSGVAHDSITWRARARLHVSGLLGRKLCWRAQAGAQIYSGFIQVIQLR